jgi:hypothetical protein
MPPKARAEGHREVPWRKLPRPNQGKHLGQQGSGSGSAASVPNLVNNFDGVGNGFSGPQGTFTVNAAPPDPNGTVGPNHFVEIVNTDFAIFNKSGGVIYGPVPINTLWSGFGGLCEADSDGDPTVAYDALADRWVIDEFAVTGANGTTTPFLECVAVSQTSDPTGAYFRYSFPYATFPDYPKIGVWPTAYFASYNQFDATGTNFLGGLICALDRSSMLSGAAATQQCFDVGTSYGGLLAASLDGTTQPPAGSTDEYVVSLGATTNTLASWRFHVDWTTPANSALTGPTALTVSPFTDACNGGGTCIRQSGTSQQLDSLGDRLMYRLAYRNFGDHEALVTSHSVTAGSSVGVRWYELRPSGGNLSVFQQGTYAPDASFRWMPSAAMDQSGGIALGYSVSSSSMHPGIRYTGRLATDAAGTMTQGEGTIITGGGSQTGNGLSRWGDYTSLAVDPADGCTFWYTNQYIPSNGSFNWRTRIGSFKLANCGTTTASDFSISVSPTSLSVQQNASGTATVSTATTSGSAQTVTLSVSGVPSGASATFNPTSVTSGGSSTLTINAGTAAAGTYTLTITGTGTSATHSTSLSLTVTSGGSSGGIVNGGFETGNLTGWSSTGSATVTSSVAHSGTYSAMLGLTSPTNGDNSISQTFTAPSSGGVLSFWYRMTCPDTVVYDWATATLKDNSAGTTATILSPICTNTGNWVNVTAAITASHSYTLTLISHDDNYFADPTYTNYDDVSILPPPPPPPAGIQNGGFETGNLSGWTSSGSASVTTSSPHSGTYAAMLGATTPTNGDSTIAQSFAAPAGTTQLTFWYRNVCPDTVTYDWATATLRDTTANTTTTILARTCNNPGGTWTQVSASIVAGHAYTLTLISHDDDYFADPTYTEYDDVALH